MALVCAVLSCNPDSRNSNGNLGQMGDGDTLYYMAMSDSANSYYDKGEYGKAIFIARQYCDMASSTCDTDYVADALSVMFCCYQYLGMLDSAINVGNTMLEYDIKIGKPEFLSSDYNNLAVVYFSNSEYAMAENLINKAIAEELAVSGSPRLSVRYSKASEIYCKTGRLAEALDLAQKAYSLDTADGNKLKAYKRLLQMGNVYRALDSVARAEECYQKALSGFKILNDNHSLAVVYSHIASLYKSLGNTKKAIFYYEKSGEICSKLHLLKLQSEVYCELFNLYKPISEEKKHFFLELYSQAKDSLQEQEKKRSLQEFQAKLETNEHKEQSERKSQQLRLVIIVSVLAAIIFVGIMLALVAAIRRRSKRNRILRNDIETLKKQMEDNQAQYLEKSKQEQIAKPDNNPQDQEFIEKLNAVIFELMEKSELSADAIASELCITSQQLRRRLQSIKNMTTTAYISSVRIGYAKQLLAQQGQLTIDQVGRLCGYDEATHFSRAFKKEVGVTPSQFRNSL